MVFLAHIDIIFCNHTFNSESQPRTSCFLLLALRCSLPAAAVLSSFSQAQSCQTLWSWLRYQMSPEWNGLFYHLTQWQLSARHPQTCKGEDSWPSENPNRVAVSISLSQDCQLSALQRHWRGSQKHPLRYGGFKERWKIARSTLDSLSLLDIQAGEDSHNLSFQLAWWRGRVAESVEKHAVF